VHILRDGCHREAHLTIRACAIAVSVSQFSFVEAETGRPIDPTPEKFQRFEWLAARA
jgi:hypothetical protein